MFAYNDITQKTCILKTPSKQGNEDFFVRM